MDSRLIYSANEKMKYKVNWPKLIDTEWIYFGADNEVNKELVNQKINSHFPNSKLYVSRTREGSFESTKQDVVEQLNNILGFEDFIIWDTSFTIAIEFNKIGVLRCGEVSE